MNTLFQDREEAGYQLSKALVDYKGSNAIIVGIPHGGVCVASTVADALNLPLEVMPCRKIKHPADGNKTIGSVCEDDVYLHDVSHTIPQDYLYHQILLLRNSISQEKRYYGTTKPHAFRYRTIILVDDILRAGDSMMACVRSIKKQNPLKIVVAVPIVSAEAARIVSAEADDIKFIKMEPTLDSPLEYFADFPRIDDNKVKSLVRGSRKNIRIYE